MTRATVTLGVLCLAQFMLILDAAVVAVAIPAIQADLTLSPAEVQGIGTAYAVTGALGFAVLGSVAFGGHGGDPAVLADAGALADGFRATVLFPALAFFIALRLPRSARASRYTTEEVTP